MLAVTALVMVCHGAASMVVFLYQAAGSPMEGVMLLFLAVTAMHFLAGGFLPLVFLPATFGRQRRSCPPISLWRDEAGGHVCHGSWRIYQAGSLAWRSVFCSACGWRRKTMKKVMIWFLLSCKRYVRKAPLPGHPASPSPWDPGGQEPGP